MGGKRILFSIVFSAYAEVFLVWRTIDQTRQGFLRVCGGVSIDTLQAKKT